VVLYCACPNDVTAARMALMLRRHGIRRVRPLAGGITAWRARGAAGEARPAATDAVLPAAR
jgi:3-mercaptopyruvate sulfurtransferase SseA